MMDFDPNKESKVQPRWATYVPSRRGSGFKTYANVGHAKNSIRRIGILYEFTNGRWEEHYRIDPSDPKHTMPEVCENCGDRPSDQPYRRMGWKWTFRHGLWKRERLCADCQRFVR